MTTALPSTDTVFLEDIAPPCEVKSKAPCDHTAEWVAVGRCCGVVVTICDHHRKKIEREASDHWYNCSRCGADLGCGLPWASVERL